MNPYIKYEKILLNLGWYQTSSTTWSINSNDSGSVINIDFSRDKKGIFSLKDRTGQQLPKCIIEEFDEAVIFRRKQYELDMGIPHDYWEIGE
jgi:hypothetical protein